MGMSEKSPKTNHKRNEDFYTPTKLVTKSSTQNNESYASRSMVTGASNDSRNQPKRAKIRSQSQPASKERPTVARTLFATDKNDGITLPMPKPLTASVPSFDEKSETFDLFDDFFRNNIKMYPQLTEIEKLSLVSLFTPWRRSTNVR